MNEEQKTVGEIIEQQDARQLAEVPQNGGNALLSIIERVACDERADISKLEKMIELQERIMRRDAEQAYSSAFARMQNELPTVTKKGKIAVREEVRSTFAKFEDIIDAVRPILCKHGFGINFKIEQEATLITVIATLRHADGHSESTKFVSVSDSSGSKNSVQAIGSTISYGKRYTLCSILGIATKDEDDDGNGATEYITNEQAADMDKRLRAISNLALPNFMKWAKVESLQDITLKDYGCCIKALSNMESEAKKKKGTANV